jgi:hypothetical protein
VPNRIIKESIRKSDSIDQLTWFEEVFFYRLIVTCDDYGRADARPKVLKSDLFPLKDGVTIKQVTDALNKLSTVGMVQVYEYDQKPFLQLVSWANHQQIRNKKSKFPEPDINCNQMNADVPVIQSNPNPNPNPKERKTPTRHKYGQYGWVLLTDEQYEKLLSDLGWEELDRCIRHVDESAQNTGNRNGWKDWNLTIRKCSRDKWGIKNAGTGRDTGGSTGGGGTGKTKEWNLTEGTEL